jgi:hypothetical protein
MAKAKTTPRAVLRRYTSLPALFHMLHNKKMTLLSPASWDDKNDAFFMAQYQQRKALKSTLALCFSEAPETYHHWRVFTHGSEGVCIAFDKDRLLKGFKPFSYVRAKAVSYKLIRDIKADRPSADDLPFLKRSPYRDEKEFRIVYSSKANQVEAKDFDIDLSTIQRITLSPWLPKPLSDALRASIRAIDGCAKMSVARTTLLENEDWKKAAVKK